jgi:hypothetical protein
MDLVGQGPEGSKEREEGRRQILKEKKEELEIRAREIAVSFAGHDTRPIRVYGTSIWDESLYKVRKIPRVYNYQTLRLTEPSPAGMVISDSHSHSKCLSYPVTPHTPPQHFLEYRSGLIRTSDILGFGKVRFRDRCGCGRFG